jgi:RNA polymerase sigma factor (sigma-70 family)
MTDASHGSAPPGRAAWFATTRWSLVVRVQHGSAASAQAALEQLCRTYWYPLYACVRRLGQSPEDAEDSVQGFFAAFLAGNYLKSADPGRGRFRSFLLMALKRYLANEWDKARAQKRGGAHRPIAWDGLTAEQRYVLEPGERFTPDQLYERRWALTLLEAVLARLQQEQLQAGRGEWFASLKEFLTSPGRGTPYAGIAARLKVSESAVKVALHRLRRRYRELLEAEIADTVSAPGEIAEERRYLLAVLSR